MTNTVYFHNTIREGEDSDSVSTTTEESPATSRRHTTTGEILSSGSVTHTPLREGGKLEISLSKSFSFKELRSATRNFHHKNSLGQGGFGMVFKGWIDKNTLVATKPGKGIPVAIKRRSQDSMQGRSEWQAEVKHLGKLYHPNLVRLFGYCLDNEQHLLVYEFIPRGSLDNHLRRRDSSPLSWSVRMKIALGAAKGLAFLHSAAINVIHRGVTSSNILLDMNYNAKISDFGLAMDGPTGGKGYIDTTVLGTYGYAEPEYIATGHLTAKSDVYSFGVVLLEMLFGRLVIDLTRPTGGHNLVEWAKPYLNHKCKIYRVLDSRLEGQYSLDGAQKAANLALQCLSMEGKFRPNMEDVVKALEELQDSKDIKNSRSDPNLSRQAHSGSGTKHSRRSAGEAQNGKVASYPRPTTSPLYA